MITLPLIDPIKNIIWKYCDTETQVTLIEEAKQHVKNEMHALADPNSELYVEPVVDEEREMVVTYLASIIFKTKLPNETLIKDVVKGLYATRLVVKLSRSLARSQIALLKLILTKIPNEEKGKRNFIEISIKIVTYPKDKFIDFVLKYGNPYLTIDEMERSLLSYLGNLQRTEQRFIDKFISMDDLSFNREFEQRFGSLKEHKLFKRIYEKVVYLREVRSKEQGIGSKEQGASSKESIH